MSPLDRLNTASEIPAIWRYGIAVLAVAVALSIRLALDPELGRRGVSLLFALAIGVAGRFGGRGAGLTATVLSVLVVWYVLTEVRFSFVLEDRTEIFNLLLLAAVGVSISLLAGQTRWALIMAGKSAQEAHQNESRARALAASLLTAQEEERRRVARELHDGICQELALLAFDVGGMAAEFPPGDPNWARLRDLQGRVAQLSDETRSVAYQLHASVLDDLGLVVALRSLCDEAPRQMDVAIAFKSDLRDDVIPQPVAFCFYRVAQEALENIRKHSGAGHVSVALSATDDEMILRVKDDGVGFDARAARAKASLGLISMEERALMVGGILSIETAPGQGTRVTLRVPFAAGRDADAQTPSSSGAAKL